MEFCGDRRLSLCKYTRVARVQDEVEIESMIDLVLVNRDMLCYLYNVKAVRGMRQCPSNHHVVLCKVRLVGNGFKEERWWLELGGLDARN